MSLILRSPWTRQPPSGTPLRRSGFTANGLVAFFDVGRGRELISGDQPTSDVGRAISSTGIGGNFTASSAQVYAHRAAYATVGAMTACVLLDCRTLTNYSPLLYKAGSNTSNMPYEIRLGIGATDSVGSFERAGAGSYIIVSGRNGFTAAGDKGKLLTFTDGRSDVVFTGEDRFSWYQDKANDLLDYGGGSPTGTAITDDGSSSVYIGARPDGVTKFDGLIFYVALYNRVLSQAEIFALANNPWLFFEPVPTPLWNQGAVTTADILLGQACL